jgi:hypothetical protein
MVTAAEMQTIRMGSRRMLFEGLMDIIVKKLSFWELKVDIIAVQLRNKS